MTTPIGNQNLQALFDGYASNLKNPNLEGERIISAGRAAGLLWELGQTNAAQALWSKETAAIAGMPSLAQFCAGYEAHSETFSAFAPGVNAFPKEGTTLSHALGAYARALEYAVNAKEPAPEKSDSRAYWAGDWGSRALTAAGFPAQAAHLKNAIETGVALPREKAKGI